MNTLIKRSLQISVIAGSVSILAACNIESSDMWSSDGYDSYTSRTVVESYDTTPAPRYHRNHWRHHRHHGWRPAPENHGSFAPPPKPARNHGGFAPAKPSRNHGGFAPAKPSADNNHGGFAPAPKPKHLSIHMG